MNNDYIPLPEVDPRPDLDIRPISGWFDEWVNGISEEQNKITLKFPLFDHEMKGKLRGKLGVVIHYGGTKKSLFAQNIAHENIYREGLRVIYSSMEMGVVELGSRFIDINTDTGTPESASRTLEELQKTEPGTVKEIYFSKIAPAYGDKLQITQNSGLTVDEYKILIDRVGGTDILIVDGLSMMGGKGTELDLASMHTRTLKELAKDRNIFVLCIVHASRGAEKTTRDVSKYARGSEKIIDNCDFYICPSLISDGNDSYMKDYGYLRLVNKRGSGNTVNLIYHFNPKRLIMKQSVHDPDEFERQMPQGQTPEF